MHRDDYALTILPDDANYLVGITEYEGFFIVEGFAGVGEEIMNSKYLGIDSNLVRVQHCIHMSKQLKVRVTLEFPTPES